MKLLTPEELAEANRLDLEEGRFEAFAAMTNHFRLTLLEENLPGGVEKLQQLEQRREQVLLELARVDADIAALPMPGIMHLEPQVSLYAYRTGKPREVVRAHLLSRMDK